MIALEARKLSDLSKNRDIREVLGKIIQQAGKGLYYIWHYTPLTEEQKEGLQKIGYYISDEKFDRNEYVVKISW